jgi:hypothetical protein
MNEEINAQRHLWLWYRQDQRHHQRRQEHNSDELKANGQVLRYVKVILDHVASHRYPLYIALHGGGGGLAFDNDQQWYHMQYYYKASVHDGVYVAPCGISNIWDLYFRPESYILLESKMSIRIAFTYSVSPPAEMVSINRYPDLHNDLPLSICLKDIRTGST